MCKFITRNAFTHSHICDKMPPVGLEPATLAPLTETPTRLTKMVTESATSFTNLKPKFYGTPDPPVKLKKD